jgi:hypothetical protein
MRCLNLRGKIMQRVNGYRFYDLGLKIHPLKSVEAEDKIKGVFFKLWEAREALMNIFASIPLRVCTPSADKIIRGIDSILPRDFQEAMKVWQSEDIVGIASYQITEGASEFATVLAAELQSLDTYLVSQKGTHSTPDLLERAEIMFPDKIRWHLPDQAIVDIRQAGRCLALDNPTASAFHVLRAVESVMAKYFQLVTGHPMPTRMRNWGIYIRQLRRHPSHSPKVVKFLDHIRESYRNPILHPEVSIAEDEAEALLGVAASAIRMLVLEIEKLKAEPMPLPLLIPEPGEAVA